MFALIYLFGSSSFVVATDSLPEIDSSTTRIPSAVEASTKQSILSQKEKTCKNLKTCLVSYAKEIKIEAERILNENIGERHVNGIECYWSVAKIRLSKFNGFSNESFVLHLKGCEFRFNYRGAAPYFCKNLQVIFRNASLNLFVIHMRIFVSFMS